MKSRRRRLASLTRVTVAVVVAAILVPCGAVAEAELSGNPPQDLTEPALESMRTALGAYEEIRAELAADRMEALPASAARLAAALRRALADRPGLAGEIPDVALEAVAASESLAEAEDLTVARMNFGELSRLFMLLAELDPRLGEGWHFFSCPMTESFGKWMQPTDSLENPYMGSAMLLCGSLIDRSVPAPASIPASEPKEAAETATSQPEFTPGIPGLMMTDVRDHKFLWREIDELQVWEHSDQISVAEFRHKAIEKTGHFLRLESPAADEFALAAFEEIDTIRKSFLERRPVGEAGPYPAGLESQFSSDLLLAASRLSSHLGNEPRHQLFAPDCKKWLLKLAFGPREAKESSEADQAGAS